MCEVAFSRRFLCVSTPRMKSVLEEGIIASLIFYRFMDIVKPSGEIVRDTPLRSGVISEVVLI